MWNRFLLLLPLLARGSIDAPLAAVAQRSRWATTITVRIWNEQTQQTDVWFVTAEAPAANKPVDERACASICRIGMLKSPTQKEQTACTQAIYSGFRQRLVRTRSPSAPRLRDVACSPLCVQ